MQEINPLKKINLEQYQKPKTLIVVHYKGKRISVPLLGDCNNLTSILYHHIDKFQQAVLKNHSNWEVASKKKIVCFCSASTYGTNKDRQTESEIKHKKGTTNILNKQVQKYLKYQDGDLKIDLLLSMIRIQSTNNFNNINTINNNNKLYDHTNNNSCTFDITKYYKYMQIQPYFIQYPLHQGQRQLETHNINTQNQNNPCKTTKTNPSISNKINQLNANPKINPKINPFPNQPKYFFYRLLQKNPLKNIYLVRNLFDGYFYQIKVWRESLAIAENQFRLFKKINCKRSESQCNEGSQGNGNGNSNSGNENGYYGINGINSNKRNNKNNCNNKNNISLNEYYCNIIPKTEVFIIPNLPQEDQQEQQQDESQLQQPHPSYQNNLSNYSNYKHLAIVSKYNIKGKLSDKLSNKSAKLTQYELVKYLKQLVCVAYLLHEQYNIIHRNLIPQVFEIDEYGDLKLTSISSGIQCYTQNKSLINYPSECVLNSSSSSRRGAGRNINRNRDNRDNRISQKQQQQRQKQQQRYNNNKSLQQQSNIHHHPPHQHSLSKNYQQQFQYSLNGQWYNINHYTPPQVLNKSKIGYNKYVDYYTIGIIIKQMYQKVYGYCWKNNSSNNSISKYNSNNNGSSNNNNNSYNNPPNSSSSSHSFKSPSSPSSPSSLLIQKIISSLISLNYQQRQSIVQEIIQGIKEGNNSQQQLYCIGNKNNLSYKSNSNSNVDYNSNSGYNQNSKQSQILSSRSLKDININLSDIKLGNMINLNSCDIKCIENQQNDINYNGINHEDIINFFKPIRQNISSQSIYQDNLSTYHLKKDISNSNLSKGKKKSKNHHDGLKVSRGEISNVSNSRDKSVKSAKSTKSKDKEKVRTKSKLLNEKGQKIQKKSKSKSHAKLISPQRNSFNNNPSHIVHIHNHLKPPPTPKNQPHNIPTSPELKSRKSKQKSHEKLKSEKSPSSQKSKQSKQKKQKLYNQTLSSNVLNNNGLLGYQTGSKIMNRTNISSGGVGIGGNIPLAHKKYKSPLQGNRV